MHVCIYVYPCCMIDVYWLRVYFKFLSCHVMLYHALCFQCNSRCTCSYWGVCETQFCVHVYTYII